MAELSHQALTAVQPEELLRRSLQMAIELIGADYGTAVRRHPDGQLSVAHELGPDPLAPGTVLPLAAERSYVLRVIGTGEAFTSSDLRRDPRVSPPGPLLERGVVSGLAVPIRGADSVMGALALHARHHRRFSRDDVAAANALASVVATAWEQAAQRERLHQQALHDPLTELPNRTLFLDRTEHDLHLAGRNGQWPAAVYIDLDGFKPVNDTYGHQAGDLLLQVFARRLHEAVRSADTAARLGGDEFAVLLHGPIDTAGVEQVLARIRTALDLPIELGGGRSATVGASLGVAFSGADTDIDTLIRRADLAMYTAKRRGRGTSVYWSPELEHAETPSVPAAAPSP